MSMINSSREQQLWDTYPAFHQEWLREQAQHHPGITLTDLISYITFGRHHRGEPGNIILATEQEQEWVALTVRDNVT